MKNGIIFLMDKKDNMVAAEVYDSVRQRHNVISLWHQLFSKNIKDCYLLIQPNDKDA